MNEGMKKYLEMQKRVNERINNAFKKGLEKLDENSRQFKGQITQYKLPTFLLFKNLTIWSDTLLNTKDFVNGEIIAESNSYNELKHLIPDLEVPTDELSHFRLIENYGYFPEECEFNDNPNELCKDTKSLIYSDKKLFGESYTIVWICPEDPQLAIDYIKNFILYKAQNINNINLIIDIQKQYLDRLCVFSSSNKNSKVAKKMISKVIHTLLSQLQEQVKLEDIRKFEKELNSEI